MEMVQQYLVSQIRLQQVLLIVEYVRKVWIVLGVALADRVQGHVLVLLQIALACQDQFMDLVVVHLLAGYRRLRSP